MRNGRDGRRAMGVASGALRVKLAGFGFELFVFRCPVRVEWRIDHSLEFCAGVGGAVLVDQRLCEEEM